MKYVLTLVCLYICRIVCAQVSINEPNFIYSQDFNSLASAGTGNTWTNNITIAGWYAASEAAGDYLVYKAGDGSSGSNGLYSFGTDALDRSLGSINQNSSGNIVYGVLFQNNSGVSLNSVTLSFTVEQWRRTQSNTKGYQRTKLSYQLANAIDVSAGELLNNANFIDLPEGYLITLDTTTMDPSQALDGNNATNRANVSVQFPITLLVNQQLFIRFYDENIGDVDMALAVEDLQAAFSPNMVENVAGVSDYSVSAYLRAGMVIDIPSENDGIPFITLSPAACTDFENIFGYFYQGDYAAARAIAENYGYVISSYSTGGYLYQVLRKESTSPYHWGSYVINTSPVKSCVTVQSPHPVKDQYTGDEGAVLFELLGAGNFMVTGISRCASNIYTSCNGVTSACTNDSSNEPYRISDGAHSTETVFHIGSVVLSNLETNMSFVQLHGFAKKAGDPDFIFSNGSDYTPAVDNLSNLKTAFQSTFPGFVVNVVHLDGASKLTAYKNVLGRHLNNYQADICASSTNATVASGRFLHLEQNKDFRKNVSNYADMASMIDASIDCGVVLPIKLLSFEVEADEAGVVRLEWEVVWERDVDRYEIQHSVDGHNFETIAHIYSANDSEGHTYTYADNNCNEGINYYRIKEVDLDGNYTFFPVKMIRKASVASFFPNPVTGVLYINGYEPGQEVKIISSTGRVLMDKIERMGDKKGIDLKGYKDGLIILEIEGQQFKIMKRNN